jgi:hypothetical protein
MVAAGNVQARCCTHQNKTIACARGGNVHKQWFSDCFDGKEFENGIFL